MTARPRQGAAGGSPRTSLPHALLELQELLALGVILWGSVQAARESGEEGWCAPKRPVGRLAQKAPEGHRERMGQQRLPLVKESLSLI